MLIIPHESFPPEVRLFNADSKLPTSAPFLIAAGCTGAVEALVYTPVDLVKTKCQVQYGREVKLTSWKVCEGSL